MLKKLIQRMNAPESISPPWGMELGIGLTFMIPLVWFLTLLVVTNGADASFEEPDPVLFAWASIFSAPLMGILAYQYIVGAVVKAHDDNRLSKSVSTWQVLHLGSSQDTWSVILFALGVVILIDALSLFLGIAPESLPIPLRELDPKNDTLGFVLGAVSLVVFRPVIEEIVFRGVLYPVLARHTPNMGAVFVTALIFAAVHFAIDPDLWWGAGLPLILGIVAGGARAATHSTQAAVGAHMMFGGFIVLRALVI